MTKDNQPLEPARRPTSTDPAIRVPWSIWIPVLAATVASILSSALGYFSVRAAETRAKEATRWQRRQDVVVEYFRDSTLCCSNLATAAGDYASLVSQITARDSFDAEDQKAILGLLDGMRHSNEQAMISLARLQGTRLTLAFVFRGGVLDALSKQDHREADFAARVRKAVGLDPIGTLTTAVREPWRIKDMSGTLVEMQRAMLELVTSERYSQKEVAEALSKEMSSDLHRENP